MADQSAFDRNHIETSAVSQTSGILDQLNLPPAVISFLRTNQRILWVIVSLVVAVVVVGSLYSSYRNYKTNQAVSALGDAMLSTENTRVELLQQVAEKYSSTPSALWARVEMAKIAADKDDIPAAIAELQWINKSITGKNPLKPLVLYRLAGLNEQKQNFEPAIDLYQELVGFSGFAPEAHYAMGRVYVAMGKKSEAIEQYRQYLSLTEDTRGLGQEDPVRTLVEHAMKQLQ